MKKPDKSTNGSELHRLTEFESYDEKVFNRMYKTCKPLITRLSANLDYSRFGVSRDIIQSYFWDKFMMVFNKYQKKFKDNEEGLKAHLISSLQTYRKRLLRCAYSGQAEFNSSIDSLDDLFGEADSESNGDELTEYREELSVRFNDWMREHLTGDEFLLFRTELDLPDVLRESNGRSHEKVSIITLIDFFELPRNKRSQRKISQMRHKIQDTIELAKKEFKR